MLVMVAGVVWSNGRNASSLNVISTNQFLCGFGGLADCLGSDLDIFIVAVHNFNLLAYAVDAAVDTGLSKWQNQMMQHSDINFIVNVLHVDGW